MNRATRSALIVVYEPVMRLALVIPLLFACGGGKEKEAQERVVVVATDGGARRPADAAPPDAQSGMAPVPGKLEVCGKTVAEEPLAAICQLGAPAAEFPFGCEQPLPLSFCRRTINWSCRGRHLPAVTYHAHTERAGPMPASGQTIDLAAMKREGPAKVIEVHIKEADEPAGEARATAIATTLERWGCVAVSRWEHATAELACGDWDAKVSYNDIIGTIIFEAAERGWLGCIEQPRALRERR